MNRDETQVFLNGAFIPRSEAKLDIEDRGAMFADGVYEVVCYHAGRPYAMREHITRLRASLEAIGINPPKQIDQFDQISNQLVQRNHLTDAKVYWQVTRGSGHRDHAFSAVTTAPTVLAIAYPTDALALSSQPPPVRAMLTEDLRWHRCSIKSLMLLPNVLAKNKALQAGYHEAIMHRHGHVTEGTATSVFIVRQGQLWTHPADQWILDGITRRRLLQFAREAQIPTYERTYTTQELLTADEVFICGTTTPVAGVVEVDGTTIGDSQVGPITSRLYTALVQDMLQSGGD